MVAGRGGDHAGLALALVHQQQCVERAAFLVGRGKLQVFELEEDLRAAQFRQGNALQGRCMDDPAFDPVVRGFDIIEIKRRASYGLDIIHIACAPNASGHRGKQ